MTILVTGATGNLGGHVIRRLLAEGAAVRALTRTPESAELPAEVEVVEGDLTEPHTLAEALRGVSAAHLLGATGEDNAPLRHGAEIFAMAADAGVRRVTVLSDDEDGELRRALRRAGLEGTLVWPLDFMANALGWAEAVREHEQVGEPYPARRTASVDEADAAEVIATILLKGGYDQRRLIVSGPESLTPGDKVAAIAAATGQQVAFTGLSDEQARELWRAQGWPEGGIEFMLHMWATLPAAVGETTRVVEEVTGRAPRTFAQWAAAHAEAFRR